MKGRRLPGNTGAKKEQKRIRMDWGLVKEKKPRGRKMEFNSFGVRRETNVPSSLLLCFLACFACFVPSSLCSFACGACFVGCSSEVGCVAACVVH